MHKTEITCEKCEQSFQTKTELKNHIYDVHVDKSVIAVSQDCDRCEFRANSTNEMKTHKDTEHITVMQCDKCELIFRFKTKLIAHKNYVHGESKKSCFECEKMFNNAHKLKKHLGTKCAISKSNSQTNDYKCPKCEKLCQTQGGFISHIQQVHADKALPGVKCDVCSKTFGSENEVVDHIVSDHIDKENLSLE